MQSAIIIAILAIYLIGMLVIGFMGKKSTGSMTEFLTAGKQGGMFVLVCSYIGAHVGNGIIVGGAQYGAQYGIGGIWYGLGACLSYVLFAVCMSRVLYRKGYITIPDLISDRYSSQVASILVAVLNICAMIAIMASQIMAGKALFAAIGLNPTLGAVVMSIVVFAYSSLSGMWGVMITDSIQSVVIFFGTLAVVLVLAMQGGLQNLSAVLPESSFEFIPFSGETFVMMLLPTALFGLISGASFQRTASAKSEKIAVGAPIIAAVALIPFVILPVIIGMYGAAVYPDADISGILFTVVFGDNINPVLAGLMVAAVLSAVMSTIDIGLLNISANAVNDIYLNVINPKADQKTLGKATAIVTAVAGVLALVLSLQFTSIISLLSKTYNMMNAGALVMVVGAIFWKKATKEGAIASAICGMGTIIISWFVTIPYVSVTSLIPALIAFIVVSLMTCKKEA